MNNKNSNAPRVLGFAAAVALLIFAPGAMAASTWNFSACNSSTPTDTNQIGGANFGNSWKCKATSGDVNGVTVSAWGKESTQASNYVFDNAYVSQQGASGFGISSRSETLTPGTPEHAADNSNTYAPDVFVFKFDTAVALDKITTGWVSGDSDMTVMAFNSAPNIAGATAASLAGWSLLEQSAGNGSTGTRTVNGSDTVASWWLISAYSASYGGGGNSGGGDYFKLLSVASKSVDRATGVAEPGSMALVAAGLVGMIAVRRQRHFTA